MLNPIWGRIGGNSPPADCINTPPLDGSAATRVGSRGTSSPMRSSGSRITGFWFTGFGSPVFGLPIYGSPVLDHRFLDHRFLDHRLPESFLIPISRASLRNDQGSFWLASLFSLAGGSACPSVFFFSSALLFSTGSAVGGS
jgi:hypothetical protein